MWTACARALIRARSAVFPWIGRLFAPDLCAACDAPSPLGAFCPACDGTVEPDTPGPSTPLSDRAQGDSRPIPDLAVGLYEGALARAIKRLKYGARPDLAGPLGDRLRRVVERGGLRGDLVIPVPLHPRKLRDRGYNQAALVASRIADVAGARFSARALVRMRDTAPQASLDREARLTSTKGAFRARDPREIQGKRVILVDDVTTTGSTLRACREALTAAGASRVLTVVLARRADHDARGESLAERVGAPVRSAR